MTRRIIQITRATLHPGTALLKDAHAGTIVAQCPLAKVADLLGHRSAAYYWATVDNGTIHLYEEVPAEQVAAA